MQQADPKLLNGIPEDQATRLIQGVFRHMNNTLAATEDGMVNCPGFGRFRVRKVEREVDGKKVSRTQILFRRAEAAGGKPADDAETDVC
jgi:nucleoid DNA-binding protein